MLPFMPGLLCSTSYVMGKPTLQRYVSLSLNVSPKHLSSPSRRETAKGYQN